MCSGVSHPIFTGRGTGNISTIKGARMISALATYLLLTIFGIEQINYENIKLMPRVYRDIQDSKIEMEAEK